MFLLPHFNNNDGQFGAGTYIFSFLGDSECTKGINFSNCSWIGNTAIYSPAVDVSPSRHDFIHTGLLPIPVFQNCKFINNTIYFREENGSKVTAGVFVISRFTVRFVGSLLFENNAYSALLLNSGQVILEQSTQVQFINNTGFRGGAIALHGFSSILISINTQVEFHNNSATEYGGAIFYYTTEQRHFFLSRSCFLQYSGDSKIAVAWSSKQRQGILCGQCKHGYSTFYHSKTFTCGKDDNCNYGIIFFILSELFPVFVFFTVIVLLDFSFTTGSRNGFIFFRI